MIALIVIGVLGLAVAMSRSLAAETSRPVRGRGYAMPSISAAIETAAMTYGIPRWFAWAQADKESGLNPSAHHGSAEDSWGLYQINMNAHGTTLAARGIDAELLQNPMVNADYFGQLARDLHTEALRRGVAEGLHAWVAVRLRLKGIGWDDFGSDLARLTVQRFQPYIRKWQERMGPG